jgi:serine/threonine-protein kinase PpkA
MASVYLAVQESLDREVALKVMAPALAANQEFTDRFLKEGRITAKLSHANLVTIFDIGQYGNIYYLAAEYIPGGTLREKLTDGGVTIAEALDVAREVALGLHYAQEKGFVHRDVKPGNVLFKSNGSAVLADFGIAKSMDQKTMATQAGSSIGTPHYMSPEQARAEKVDGRSDLYSLGAMLFEMLTGSPPYDAGDPFTIALMHVTHPLPQLPPDLQWLQPLINGLMAKSPDDRYPNGEAFSVAADKLLQSAPQGAAVRDGQDSRKRVVPRLSRTDQQTGVRGGGRSTQSRMTAGTMRSPAVLYGGIAAAVLAVAVIGWFVFGGKTTAPPSDPPVVVTPTQPDTTPTVDPPTVPVTDLGGGTTSSDDVGGLIARANEYMKIGLVENGRRISSPPGDCAVDLYLRALSIDANNPEAKAGLGQIAAYYESKAKAAYDRGIFNGSMVLAEQGLKADPGNAALQKIAADSKKSLGL